MIKVLMCAEERGGVCVQDLLYILEIIKGVQYPDREVPFDEIVYDEDGNIVDGVDIDEETGQPKQGLARYIVWPEEGYM